MIKIHRCEQEDRVNNKKEKRGGKIQRKENKIKQRGIIGVEYRSHKIR